MNRAQAVPVAVILVMASGPGLWAGTRKAPRADAPQQLGEALASGTADVETIASLVRWVLEEEPEEVAPGLAAALQSAIADSPAHTDDPRWSAAARAAVPELSAALADSDTAVREAAAQALKRIQEE